MHIPLLRGLSCVVLSVLLALSCNQRHPIDQTALAVVPSTAVPAPVPPPPAATTLLGMTLSPRGILGGSNGHGTLLLTLPAPPGGFVVAVSSTDPSVSVPTSVAVPAGRDNADFIVTTQQVPADRGATIVASIPERNVSASLTLWSLEPTFLSFANDPPDVNGSEATRRVLPPTASFTAFCSGNSIDITITEGSRDRWFGRFIAPSNRRLAVGTYEVSSTATANTAYMSLGGTGLSCSNGFVGQFTIQEANYNPLGPINRFWASFDVRCGGSLGRATRGDLRLTSVPMGSLPFSLTCNVP